MAIYNLMGTISGLGFILASLLDPIYISYGT